LLIAITACGQNSQPPSTPGGPTAMARDSVILMGGQNTTVSSLANTSLRNDSVVVMPGQDCYLISVEVKPATTPPTYRVTVQCAPRK
jgi:hypothetical protein